MELVDDKLAVVEPVTLVVIDAVRLEVAEAE